MYDGLDFDARSLVGHVEVIEMGVVTDTTATDDLDYKKRNFTPASWATHDTEGNPANCDALVDAWDPTTGVWAGKWKFGGTATTAGEEIGSPTGGLYGLSNVLDSADAAAFGVEPAAIADFWASGGTHSDPGNNTPSLGSGDNKSIVSKNGKAYELTFGASAGWDAVSSLFMQDALYNDVMINSAIGGMTDWVVTFPTKREYVNDRTVVKAPFTELYASGTASKKKTYAYANLACEEIMLKQWNREESTPVGGKIQFSPKPLDPLADEYALCLETNTIAIGGETVESVFGTVMAETKKEYLPGSRISFIAGETEGWMKMSFENAGQYLKTVSVSPNPFSSGGTAGYDTNGGTLDGLPAIGFAAFKYANGDRTYGFVSDHKGNVAGSAVGDKS
jgi:hypothetical protein